MDTKLRTAAITDEFCPDIEAAAQAMADIGMTGAELRVVFGKNILDLTDSEVDAAKAAVNAKGLEVVSLSSPLLKCVLPDSPPVDTRFQHDVFASKHTFEDQPRLTRRAFEIAHKTGARVIRVFSYWRTIEPEKCFDRIAEALGCLARDAAKEDIIIGVENEHACNISTGADTARLLAAVDHPNLQVVWDPANAYVAGEIPFPDGYRALPASRIAHVHAKDCRILDQHKPIWGPLGTCDIDWKGQIAALLADGYSGWVSLETHWPGPKGNKFQASIICGCNLQSLLSV
ncbi:MAG: sugar phosphate isomerase/epimerase family protein [Rhodospirillales bacterium]